MAKKQFSGKMFMTRIVILFIYVMCVADTLVNVALGEITVAFPNASSVSVSLIANAHTITCIIASLVLVPFLASRFDKKNLLICAMLGYSIFGMLGAVYSPSVTVIIVEQLFFGITMAFAAPLSLSYVNELYDDTDRENMLGWQQTFSSLIGTGLSLVAGVLCAIRWRYTFWCYAIFIVGVILMFFFLPSSKTEKLEKTGKKVSVLSLYTRPQKIKLALAMLFIIAVLTGIITFNIKTSIIIEERGMGNAALAGVAQAMSTIGTLALSALYGFFQKIMKRYVFFLGIIITGLGCFIGAVAATPAAILLGAFLGGAGMGVTVPALYSKLMNIGHPDTAVFASSMCNACMSAGMFLATFFELVVGIFVERTTRNILMFDGFMFVGIFVILIIYFIWSPLKGTDYVSEEKRSL